MKNVLTFFLELISPKTIYTDTQRSRKYIYPAKVILMHEKNKDEM